MQHGKGICSSANLGLAMALAVSTVWLAACTGFPNYYGKVQIGDTVVAYSTPQTSVSGSSAIAASAYVQQVLDLTNSQRTLAGLKTLTLASQLNNAALTHTQDMVTNNYFAHIGTDGSDPGQRITAAGYPWSAYGENIAKGFKTPQDVVTAWMNSPEHRDNILNPVFTQMGAAVIGDTWTQEFGTPR